MTIPDVVRSLVERFRDQHQSYISPHYNEAQTRKEFIDPLFGALGWDMDNTQEYAEAYKDVIHEDSIKIAGDPKEIGRAHV